MRNMCNIYFKATVFQIFVCIAYMKFKKKSCCIFIQAPSFVIRTMLKMWRTERRKEKGMPDGQRKRWVKEMVVSRSIYFFSKWEDWNNVFLRLWLASLWIIPKNKLKKSLEQCCRCDWTNVGLRDVRNIVCKEACEWGIMCCVGYRDALASIEQEKRHHYILFLQTRVCLSAVCLLNYYSLLCTCSWACKAEQGGGGPSPPPLTAVLCPSFF